MTKAPDGTWTVAQTLALHPGEASPAIALTIDTQVTLEETPQLAPPVSPPPPPVARAAAAKAKDDDDDEPKHRRRT